MRLGSRKSLRLAPGFVIVSVFSALILLFSLSCQNQEQAPASDAAAMVVDSVASEDGVIVYYDVRGSGEKT
ncbi:MAG: hypothetical protein JSU65_08360, partial [Candidatus Zixiibacteriota bacterium]